MTTKTRQSPDVKASNLSLVLRFSENERVNAQFHFWNLKFDRNLVQFNGSEDPLKGVE